MSSQVDSHVLLDRPLALGPRLCQLGSVLGWRLRVDSPTHSGDVCPRRAGQQLLHQRAACQAEGMWASAQTGTGLG